ncbi:MAG TPA: LytTR family DNA-binding domain-containing protein [Gemmataceae bacterium]|nr:LytTR family DNA-binding domain-containing protein [Gemmataceae bacterium]
MPAPIRTLIVDDEPLCRERLRTLLADDPDFTIVGECGDGAEAVATLRETPCDLVFLDVQMPVMDGLEVVEAIGPERMPTVIFVTAYDRYALRAFEVQALDYLLKPFDRERFEKALGRAKAHVQRDQSAEASRQLLALLGDTRPGRKHLERLVIKSGGRIFFLKMEEIDWIEAAGNYLRLHVGTETHLLRETMNALEGRIDPERFLRIHRSTIVNIERIREIQPLFHGDYVVLLRDGTELTLSRTYRQRLQEVLGATL